MSRYKLAEWDAGRWRHLRPQSEVDLFNPLFGSELVWEVEIYFRHAACHEPIGVYEIKVWERDWFFAAALTRRTWREVLQFNSEIYVAVRSIGLTARDALEVALGISDGQDSTKRYFVKEHK